MYSAGIFGRHNLTSIDGSRAEMLLKTLANEVFLQHVQCWWNCLSLHLWCWRECLVCERDFMRNKTRDELDVYPSSWSVDGRQGAVFMVLLMWHLSDRLDSKKTRHFDPMYKCKCWPTVYKDAPTINQHWSKVSSSKHGTLPMCYFNAGPASQTMGQHWPNTRSMSRVCWGADLFTNLATRHVPANCRFSPNVGLMLVERRSRWPNVNTTLG